MPGELSIWNHSFDVAADLSTYSNRFVMLSAGKTVNVCDASHIPIGILQNAKDCTAAGRAASVRVLGVAMLTVNANSPNIAAGDWIGPTTNGIGIQMTADKKIVGAIALEAATADGVEIEVLLVGPGYTSL